MLALIDIAVSFAPLAGIKLADAEGILPVVRVAPANGDSLVVGEIALHCPLFNQRLRRFSKRQLKAFHPAAQLLCPLANAFEHVVWREEKALQ